MSQKDVMMCDYFSKAPVAILIFQDDELVVSNELAQTLQSELNISPRYLADVAQATVQRKASQTGCCPRCLAMGKTTDVAMPVLSQCPGAELADYYMTYTLLDNRQNKFALTLKNYSAVKRMNVLADQKKLNCYINDAHEEERKHISADLHDSIAQGVYAAIMGVRKLNDNSLCAQEVQQRTTVIESQLNDTLREVKDMALNIRPSVLDSLGLVAALKTLGERIETATDVKITVAGNAQADKLTKVVQNTMYRVAQEAINNALKHAEATEILLILVEHQDYISLQIIDDGVGFNVTQHQAFNGHSLGLHDMADRIKALNGIFEIESKLAVGTTVTVKFPVQVTEGSFSNA